ncbi:MAG: GNAT family N-acetyltransferase, partial [Acidobacteria bacterium]|nr:GNAT family N-acetyltransferase [Acidobacteriota bacterium]
FLLGVDERFAGRGIAQQLITACLARGEQRGYRMAVTEATNETSQHIVRKHGFVEQVKRSYGQHRFQGQAFFESIADQGGPILMDKKLSIEDH